MAKLSIAKVQDRMVSVSSEILGLIKTGCRTRIWESELPVKYPKSHPKAGEDVIGKDGEPIMRKTANLDIVVDQSLFNTVSKALEVGKEYGVYLQLDYNNVTLIAIKARVDEQNDLFIIQFTKPNSGSWIDSNDEAFSSKFTDVFGGNSGGSQKTAAVPVESDEMPF